MAQPKVFKMDDCTWWAGYDLESVKRAFLSEMDLPESEIKAAHEVANPEMQRLKFVEGDDPVPAEGWTFQQQLDHMVALSYEFPCFFATTEW